MKFLALSTGLVLLSVCHTASALVVKESGRLQLAPDTVLVVTSAMEIGVPVLKYAVEHTNPDGKVLSSNSDTTHVDVGNPIVFYWDSGKQVLWWATGKTLVSVPRAAWERPEGDPSHWLPIIYTMDEKWITNGGEKIPFGGIPAGFFDEVKRTFPH